MNSTKVIQLLSELNPQELKAFRKYIYSPYFNTHNKTAVFFDVIYKFDPTFSGKKLTSSKIFKKVYPEEEFCESKMRMLRKYLFKHLLKFLAQREFEKHSMEHKLNTLNSLLNLDDPKFFNSQVDKIQEEFDNKQEEYSRNYLYKYQFENTVLHFQTIHGSRWETKNFEKVNAQLSQFFAIEKLRLYCSQLNESFILDNEIVEDPIINFIIGNCEQHFDELSVVTKAYFCMAIIGIDHDRLDCFERLKAELPNINKYCLKADRINIYNYLINFCYKLYRQGKPGFQKEMFVLYKEMLDYQLLFKQNLLSINHYKNISTLGLRLGEFEWTREFIENHKDVINEKYRDAVYAYNMALWHFYHKDYREALQYLQQMVFIDPFYKISHDLLLLKVYFEKNEEDAFMALCLNFQNFIRRKKILESEQQRAYLNFIQSARALFLVKIGEREKLSKAIERLEKSEVIVEKRWLMNQAKQLSIDASNNN